MPRVSCPSCSRPVALMPLTGRAGHGTVHDHKRHARELVLCPGSMVQLPLTDATVFQDQLDLGLPPAPAQETLFDHSREGTAVD